VVTNARAEIFGSGRAGYRRDSEPSAARPLRILCLNYEYPPMGGGAGNATMCTAAELARRGHTVHVLTSRLPAQPAVETIDSVTVCRVVSLRRSLHECGLFGAVSYLACALIQLVRLSRTYDYDIYHFYFGLPTGILAPYVGFVLKKPYVIALRGSDVPGYDETRWYMRPLHKLLRPISRFLWRHAKSVKVLSKNLQELALKTDSKLRSHVIPNGINGKRFPAKPAGPERRHVRLISVCRMVPRKGLEFLIEAMQELRNDGIRLELIGSGHELSRVAALVTNLGLDDYVSLPGYIPSEQLYTHYHRADIFVLPSLSESFGQVLLEAMSCGLPVVASTAGGIPETIRHGRNGLLVPPRDSAALVEAVRWLANNPKQRARIGRFNAEHARQIYGWPAVAARYEALYYRAVNARSRQDAA
jgi:glycosyltransferase involved in cell wall biosynthesis